MLSAPTSTAPAASMRSTSVASRDDGARSRLIFDPARVGRPFTSNRFFTANGTPASGPTFCPAAIAASTARALARARSAVTSVKEFRMGSCLAIRANAASVASSAVILRPATACAISWAESPSEFTVIALSGCVDTGRLGFVGQWEFIDQPCQSQRYFQVRPHRGSPGILNRQRKGACDGVDIIVKRIAAGLAVGSAAISLPFLWYEHDVFDHAFREPATADAGSPSAVPLYRHPADCPRPCSDGILGCIKPAKATPAIRRGRRPSVANPRCRCAH